MPVFLNENTKDFHDNSVLPYYTITKCMEVLTETLKYLDPDIVQKAYDNVFVNKTAVQQNPCMTENDNQSQGERMWLSNFSVSELSKQPVSSVIFVLEQIFFVIPKEIVEKSIIVSFPETNFSFTLEKQKEVAMNEEFLKNSLFHIAPGVTAKAVFASDKKLESFIINFNNVSVGHVKYSEKLKAVLVPPSLIVNLNNFDPFLNNFRRVFSAIGLVSISMHCDSESVEQIEKDLGPIVERAMGIESLIQTEDVWGPTSFQNFKQSQPFISQSPQGAYMQFHNNNPQSPVFNAWGQPAAFTQVNSIDPVIRSQQLRAAIEATNQAIAVRKSELQVLEQNLALAVKDLEALEGDSRFSLAKSLREAETILKTQGDLPEAVKKALANLHEAVKTA